MLIIRVRGNIKYIVMSFFTKILRLSGKATSDFVMDEKLLHQVLQLKAGERIKINNTTFVIQEVLFHKSEPQDEPCDHGVTRFELGNNYVLEFHHESPHFFQLVEKRSRFFTTTQSAHESIVTIELV